MLVFKDLFISASMYGPSVNMQCLIMGRVVLSCPQLVKEALRRAVYISYIVTARNLTC